jgi:hypothetical protein
MGALECQCRESCGQKRKAPCVCSNPADKVNSIFYFIIILHNYNIVFTVDNTTSDCKKRMKLEQSGRK